MGNRAVITASKDADIENSNDIGVYLHWNGGRDSVEAFLKYCEMKEYRSPDEDFYGWACLCKVIGNYFGNGLSLGIDRCCHLDCNNFDNGVYIIKGWKIVDRKCFNGIEQEDYDIYEMLCDIDAEQPLETQIGKDKIKEYLDKENAQF